MSGWRDWLYPFPDDDLDSLWQIMDRLPVEMSSDLDWAAPRAFVVTVAKPKVAVYLRMAFENDRLDGLALDGLPLLSQDEVLISLDDRAECERMLAENCPSTVRWSALVRISVLSDEAHRAFGAAYTAITGLPSAAPDRSATVKEPSQHRGSRSRANRLNRPNKAPLLAHPVSAGIDNRHESSAH